MIQISFICSWSIRTYSYSNTMWEKSRANLCRILCTFSIKDCIRHIKALSRILELQVNTVTVWTLPTQRNVFGTHSCDCMGRNLFILIFAWPFTSIYLTVVFHLSKSFLVDVDFFHFSAVIKKLLWTFFIQVFLGYRLCFFWYIKR